MDLTVQTMYSGKMKEGLATPTGEQAPVNTPEARSGTALQSIAQDIGSSYGESPKSTFLRDDSMDSVPQSDGENNPQYSLKGTTITKTYNQLLKENDALRERVEYWRGQTRQTKEVTTDKKAVNKAARTLVENYGAQMDTGELSGRLQALYNHMARTWYANGEVENSDVWRGAEEIARDIAGSAVEEWSLAKEFPGLKEKLRDTPITISREYDGDIRNENFRRDYRGKLKLSSQGPTNVDAVYSELAESYPGLFPADITHPADQMEQIMDVADSLTSVERQARFSGQMEEAVTGITNEIVEQFLALPLTRATFADQQAMKLDELRAENKEAVRNAIARERSAREKQVAELKDKYKARTEAGREKQNAAELRGKITRHAKSLSDKLLRPTDKAHIPEELRGPVAKVLESINLESQYKIDPETGKRVKGGDGDPVKRTQAFLELKQKYTEISKNGGDLVIDPALLGSDADGIQGSFDAVIAMGDTPIASMNSEQLSTMWQVLKSVEHSVSTAGKLLSQGKFERTSQWADALDRDTRTRRNKRPLTKNHATLDLENPYTFFSHFGQAGKDMYRTLRDAQDRQQVLTNRVSEETAKVVDEKTAKKLEKTTHDYTTEGGQKLTLSTAQVMELYELSKRKQAREHLLVGGIVQPEIRGTKIRRGTDAIRLTVNDLTDITGTLTAEEMKIADGLQTLTATVLADMGNEASMTAYGYRKFTEADYWPIRSAREGLHSSIEKGGDNARAIKNTGMAQATVPNANNQVDIGSIFDTFARHTGDMVDYAAWLCPMEDLNRVYNYKYRDGEGNPTGATVKGLLDAKGGEGSQKYWHDLMEDIQNGIKAKNDSPIGAIASKGIGAFKGAAVGGNIRVIIQQPTAFFRAGAVLNPADMALGLAKGATKGNGWKKALQYSPIAMRKDAGGFDISSPGTMKETLFGGKGAVDKVNDALSWGAGKADAVTWGWLWNASEWQVARQHKELKKGSKEFYGEVNRVFTDMVDQTQVVDGILQRANIMRSQNAMVQQATSFMGEPLMSLNLTMRAWDQLRNEQDPKKRGKAIRNLGRAATALTVTAAVNAVAQSLVDAMRDDDKDKKYWERFETAFTGQEGDEESPWERAVAFVMEGNFGSNLNPAGQIPYIKDIQSLIQGYDVSRTELSVIQDLIENGQNFIKSADGHGSKTRAYALNKLLASGAKMFGIPAANLERDFWAFGRSIVTETGNLPAMYEMEKAIYNIGSEKNKSRFEDIMYRALETGELDTYTHIQDELMNIMGLDGAALESAMKSRYNARAKKDPDYSLPKGSYDLLGIRPQSGNGEKDDTFGPDDLDSEAFQAYSTQRAAEYRKSENALAGNPIFKGMDEDTRNKVLQAAYDLAESGALADASGGQYTPNETWILDASEAEKKGIEPWEFALWRVAKSDAADTKGADGKAVKGETKKDHVMDWLSLSGLSEEQQEFLWGTAYTSDFDEYRDDLAEYRSYGPQMDAAYEEMSSGLEGNPIFAGMDAELREKVTDAALEAAKQRAQAEVIDDYEYKNQWIATTEEAEAQGISAEDYVLWHVVCGNTYSNRDANGNEIPGQAKKDQLRAWLRGNDTLTEQQRAWLWGQQYKSAW